VRYTVPAHRTAGPFEPHSPGTREVFVIQEGEVSIRAGHHTVELSRGDLAVLPGDVSHVVVHDQDSEAVLVLFITRRH
jgi:mannose-6-phosphate isomerase-like protein (cupin superfamily)